MKFVAVLLLTLPLAFATPVEKRAFLDLLDINKVKCFLQHIVDIGKADETEQACEVTCHSWLHADDSALIHTFCTPVCRSAQELIGTFQITESGGTGATNSQQCPSA